MYLQYENKIIFIHKFEITTSCDGRCVTVNMKFNEMAFTKAISSEMTLGLPEHLQNYEKTKDLLIEYLINTVLLGVNITLDNLHTGIEVAFRLGLIKKDGCIEVGDKT